MIDLVAGALRGERCPAPGRADWSLLFAVAGTEGVLPLLAAAASRQDWPGELVERLRMALAGEVALELARRLELARLVERLAADGVPALLLKGAHLSSTHYPAPGLRPRSDTDLLIRAEDRAAVRASLSAAGYSPAVHVTGDVAFTQFHYERVDERGVRHALDVHWRIVNPRAFADRLPWDELWRSRVAVPGIAPCAFAPDARMAFVIACLHRVAHHGCSARLLWLYDLHLLAGSLSEDGWQETLDLCRDRGLSAIIAAGLESARAFFHTDVPARILAELESDRAAADAESRAFLEGRRPAIAVFVSDWRHLPTFRERLTFLRDHLLPSAPYMKDRYGVSTSALLPLLYVYRLLTGSRRWLLERP